MKCRKQLVLNGYRVQYVDLRQPKPKRGVELDLCLLWATNEEAPAINMTKEDTAE